MLRTNKNISTWHSGCCNTLRTGNSVVVCCKVHVVNSVGGLLSLKESPPILLSPFNGLDLRLYVTGHKNVLAEKLVDATALKEVGAC